MNKTIFYYCLMLFSLSLFMNNSYSQSCMPTNSDYSNWDWEDQAQCNWRMSTGGVWNDLNPPFLASTSRLDFMEEIYTKSDFSRAKGWRLMEASFGPDVLYPYFALYNKFRGIIRVFFYLGDNYPSNYAAASCSFASSAPKPGVLSFGNNLLITPDKYYADPYSGNDEILVVIPNAATRHWAAADFPILFDPYLTDVSYQEAKFEFKLYAVQNYAIQAVINGVSSTDPSQLMQHTIIGNKSAIEQTTLNKLSAGAAKLVKKLNAANEVKDKLTNAINKIDTNDVAFLQKLKKNYQGADASLGKLFTTAAKIVPILSATLELFEYFQGLNPSSEASTMPTATYQLLNLTGTMDIQQLLAGFSIKVPGAQKSSTDTKNYYYDCPVGVFNLKESPKLNVTTPYERIACPGQSVIYQNPYPVVSGYNGYFKKYQIPSDFLPVWQQTPGVHLTDIKVAFLCKPQINPSTGLSFYKITDPFIKTNRFTDVLGRQFDKQLDNPIYQALLQERLVVHRYDKDNQDVYYGSPYVDLACLKGFTIEVPENTDVSLGVIATFTIDGQDEPFIFHGKYMFEILNTIQAADPLRCGLETEHEQSSFPYSDYYNTFFVTLNNDPNSSQYWAYSISLTPGFSGEPGFLASALENYKCLGNAYSTQTYNYNCPENLRTTVADAEGLPVLDASLEVFPNPTQGRIRIKWDLENEQDADIAIFNSLGSLVYHSKSSIGGSYDNDIDLADQPDGMYFVNIKTNGRLVTRKIVLSR